MAYNANEFPVDLTAHVLPIMELCRFASMSCSAVQALHGMGQLSPDLKRQLETYAPYLSELAESDVGDRIGAALWVAIDLLERYNGQPSKGRA